jgi:sugar phosphate isomerase/epimerase
MSELQLQVGVKTDPIECRFSYEWLFRLMAEEGIHHAQLGSFVEMYFLPDEFFVDLRQLAERYGIVISSVFSTHREMGGFFRPDHPAWAEATRRIYKRLIEIGLLVGGRSAGGNPGAVMRDQMAFKEEGIRRYLAHMKEMMEYAHARGMPTLTIEPMSCLAEPPTLPEEISTIAEELLAFHRAQPDRTASVGYCVDVSHGYADQEGNVQWGNMQLVEAALPYLDHVHLKNTDQIFNATFGFRAEERARGIVQIEAVRELLLARAADIPVKEIIGYFEINGPKTGRDYSDYQLEEMLRESLSYLRQTFR